MTAEQLRNSILQEAISGRLVPQDPNDEPASALLARIREEKARLVKEGTIKAKEVLEYTIDDIPYELPDNWSWVKLGEISYPIKRGKSPVYVENSQYIAFAQKCNTKKGYIDLGLAKYIESKKAETQADIYLKLGDIVINSTGTGTLGRVGLFNVEYPENIIGVVPDSHVATVRLLSIYPEYAYYFLRTCQAYLESLGEGGTNQKELKPSSIAELLFPLPPLAEQKRIVAKLEELLPIVEQYGKAQTELDELNAALPARLRQSILQEAISGRLVPQDPNDEPVAILSSVPEDDIPFEIPSTWRWVFLKDCATIIGGYAFPSASIKGEKGVRVIRISDFNEKGFVNKSVVRYNGHENLDKFKIIPQDILIAMTGGTVGKSLFVQKMEENMLLNQRVAIIRNNGQYAPYIDIVVKSPHIKSFINDKKNSTNDNISMGDINAFLVPLPPLAEQQRIVAKIEELFEQINKITM